MKVTAVAPANVALIKYWGKKNEELKIPTNGSVSVNLSGLLTTTTVEFSHNYQQDEVVYNQKKENKEHVIKHLNLIRQLAKISDFAKVVTTNNFPSSTGLSSSASGFASLTLAATSAAGLSLSEKELSIMARQGSGSACRSIPDGFVEWQEGESSQTSYAKSLYPPEYWEIVDIVVIVSQEKKTVSSTAGQKLYSSSPFFALRLNKINDKIKLCKNYLQKKDFTQLGELVEQEALEMHTIMLTSKPSLIYWTTGTLTLMKLVKQWREDGLEVYFTINTGQNIHLLCERKNLDQLVIKLKTVSEVKDLIVNTPANGARIIDQHLF